MIKNTIVTTFFLACLSNLAVAKIEKSYLKQADAIVHENRHTTGNQVGEVIPDSSTSNSLTFKYFNTTDFVVSTDLTVLYNDLAYGFQTVNGFKINDKFSLGLGIGYEKYESEKRYLYGFRATHLLVPVFTDFRWYFGEGRIRPYLAQGLGYAFCIKQNEKFDYYGEYKEKGGIMANPSVGISTKFNTKLNFNFNIGYRYQENKRELTKVYEGYEYLTLYNLNKEAIKLRKGSNLITLKAGVTF